LPSGSSFPEWSPDGEQIAFVNQNLYVMNADGSGVTQIVGSVPNAQPLFPPAWSPDGERIAFRTVVGSASNDAIRVVSLDTLEVTTLFQEAGTVFNLDWQPLSPPPPVNSYVRPAGATPIRLSLVPAFAPCAAPNRAHGSPLAFGSCSPPVDSSGSVTVGPSSSGFVKIKVLPGVPGPPSDTEVQIKLHVTDVRCKSGTSACGNVNSTGGPDYTGELQGEATIRLTDRYNGPGGNEAATVVDMPMPVNAFCANTASAEVGSTCTVAAGPLIPDPCQCEGKRMVAEVSDFRVRDGGPDGLVGTEPNTPFLRQGLFVP
jgi:hypothetical protein